MALQSAKKGRAPYLSLAAVLQGAVEELRVALLPARHSMAA